MQGKEQEKVQGREQEKVQGKEQGPRDWYGEQDQQDSSCEGGAER